MNETQEVPTTPELGPLTLLLCRPRKCYPPETWSAMQATRLGSVSDKSPGLGIASSEPGTITCHAMLEYLAITLQWPSWILWELYGFPYAVSQPVLTSFLAWVGIGVFALSWIDVSNRPS